MSYGELNNLASLVAGIASEAQQRLCEGDKEFDRLTSRMWDLHEELEDWAENPGAQQGPEQAGRMWEYFDLQAHTRAREDTALYLTACLDCLGLLSRLGWLAPHDPG